MIYAVHTSLIRRLKAEKCELCGAIGNVEMHHVNKLKNLKGKAKWEKFMLARRRKTVALCEECHGNIHYGN